MKCDLPFDGKAIVLGGDFGQVLPVVRHGSRTTFEASVRRSPQWAAIEKRRLITS